MDRRRYRRQEIPGKVRIRWADESGNDAVALGRIRNVSARGALLEAETFPPVGTQISLDLQLKDSGKRTVTLEAKGLVKRVEGHSIAVATGIIRIRKIGGNKKTMNLL